MRYFTKRHGQKEAVPVDIEPAGDNRYKLTYEGRTLLVDALALESGAMSLLVDGTSHNVELEEVGDEVLVQVGGQTSRIDVADERRLRLRAGKAGFTVEGKQLIAAPMPGKVIKVLVKLGDEVKEGQGLVVVEAMKMENELKSPKAGKVVELPAKEGTAVEINAKLVVVE
ncbi:acetyl-CoA carboxylase biotin carboxyl carrier protein subunit [Melittangium boletus]|uniref:Acetyl-CoA carboxylase biotin carboxyl carrier protein subunit n=1 Tax=Melittangium boletus DSM 14713 TaxID=1294270 RepID=A0A250IIK9_9BACT|nr:acetyl-CoA carboxylase biotin carboxyl carrier protein subunit [Melittangium boletus]ATB31108.1 acetyl-CoA carboxylase biotin carboxyl carrier protein subunit [Melittangium boletus DSM 14713]